MLFEITEEGHILTITEDLPGEAERSGPRFTNEQELQEMASAWPMKRLLEIWNRFPGVAPVQKFENRRIAISRIWRAVAGDTEAAGATVPSRTTGSKKRIAFREGSKGAHVFLLLARPEGATLSEIRAATGWQAHTVRGFVSRTLRKQGRKVRSFQKDGERVYRLKL
ncbi:MAG: DUF3489 domain-containing protein [Bryobacteraceae bacterium]